MPIVLAPMGGSAGGELAAAVAMAGGIGLVGSGGGTLEVLRKEWAVAIREIEGTFSPGTYEAYACRKNLGFGININQVEEEFPPGTLAMLVEDLGPGHVYLSFGDIAPHVADIRAARGGSEVSRP